VARVLAQPLTSGPTLTLSPNPNSNQVANLLHDQGRLEEARLLFEEALHACREQLGDRHEDTLALINNLGSLLYDQEPQPSNPLTPTLTPTLTLALTL